MTLSNRRLFIWLPVEINLSDDLVAKPVSVAPDIWVGLGDALAVGALTSSHAFTGFWGGVGDGACLRGEVNGCPRVFDNAGVAARFNLAAASGGALGVEVGMFATSFDPFTLVAKAGVTGMIGGELVRLLIAPSFFVGLTERDAGNEESLSVPLALMIGPDAFRVGLQSGALLQLEDIADTYVIPASVGVQAGLGQAVLFAAFSLPSAVVGEMLAVPDGFDARTLTLGVAVTP
jgi:hypothetical protein